MTYTMKYADDADKGKFDEVVTHENSGVKVIIDPAALMHIIGTKMDFVQDRIRSEACLRTQTPRASAAAANRSTCDARSRRTENRGFGWGKGRCSS